MQGTQESFVNEIKVEQNATIALFEGPTNCLVDIENPSCEKYLSNNFTLAPEVCLWGFAPHASFRLLEMPKCVGSDGESPAVLVTYSDEKCTGPAMVQPSTHIGPFVEPIQFPFPSPSPPFGRPERWSLIFHCHPEPFDEVSDPFERVYTTGEKLQDPLKPQGPLALCEHLLPRLTDGMIRFIYEGCSDRPLDSWKWYDLLIDTC